MAEPTAQDREIREYIRKYESMSPREILQHMGRLRDFIYNNMTPEGRRHIELEKLADSYRTA